MRFRLCRPRGIETTISTYRTDGNCDCDACVDADRADRPHQRQRRHTKRKCFTVKCQPQCDKRQFLERKRKWTRKCAMTSSLGKREQVEMRLKCAQMTRV